MHKSDAIRLRHMLDAAQEAIEIVGEAASRVSRECQERYSAIPWASIVAMRNRLIHAYFDIDLDRVWDTVLADLPPLVAELAKIVPPLEPGG